MEFPQIDTATGAAITALFVSLGGFITVCANIMASRRKEFRDEKRETTGLVVELQTAQIHKLEREIEILRSRLTYLESMTRDFHLPSWGKDKSERIIWVNPAFESEILEPMGKTIKDAVGRKPTEVFGDEIGKKLMRLSRKVQKSNSRRGIAREILFHDATEPFDILVCVVSNGPQFTEIHSVAWPVGAVELTDDTGEELSAY